MLEPGLLDTILTTFEAATQTGISRLGGFAFAALTFCALVAWYREYGTLVLSGSPHMAESVGNILLRLISVGIFYWLVKNGIAMTQLLLASVTELGGLVAGDPTLGTVMRHPSAVLTLGMVIGRPMLDMVDRLGSGPGLGAITTLPKQYLMLGVWVLLVATFAVVAIHLVFLIIEFQLSAIVAFIGLPFALLPATAFLAEFGLGWLFGSATRILVVSVVTALAWPLLGQLILPPLAPNVPDPTYAELAVIVTVSLFFAIVSWTVPARTAALAQRGIGLSGQTLATAAAGAARFAAMAATAGRAAGAASALLGAGSQPQGTSTPSSAMGRAPMA